MSSQAVALPHALKGDRRELDSKSGRVSYYTAGPNDPGALPPLLLIHSVNAAAGAHEMRPLYDHYRQERVVYAPDLPGYGFSERSERLHTPRLMTDAVHALTEEIKSRHGGGRIDALALSLSSEFLARAGVEDDRSYRSLALISPTGFNRKEFRNDEPGSNRGKPTVRRIFTQPWLGRNLFRLLTSRPSVRFFLEKTWGSKNIDETMFEYSCLTARQPGAMWAPFDFLSGFLFSADLGAVYPSLQQPVWMVHGVRGDFTDYRLKHKFEDRANWRIRQFDSGALPHFEMPATFVHEYSEFLAAAQGCSEL
mgnify:CR=1 FL=1